MKHSKHIKQTLTVGALLLTAGALYHCHDLMLLMKPQRHVAVVFLQNEGQYTYDQYITELHNALKAEGVQAKVHPYYLDCERYEQDLEEVEAGKILKHISHDFKADAVVLVGDQATYSCLVAEQQVKTQLPIVFSGVLYPNLSVIKANGRVTGVRDSIEIVPNVRMCQQLSLPLNTYTTLDNTFLDRKTRQQIELQLADAHDIANNLHWQRNINDIAYHYREGSTVSPFSMRDMPANFTNLHDENHAEGVSLQKALHLFGYMTYIQTKVDRSSLTMLRFYSERTYLTAISHEFGGPSSRFLAGYFASTQQQAADAARIVTRILAGEAPADIPIRVSAKDYYYDWNVAKQFGLKLSDIPKGYEVINLTWQEKYPLIYRWYVASIVLFTSALFLGLLYITLKERRKRHLAQKRLENEHKLANQANAAKTAFLTSMSHDIRTPMNAIIGFTSLAQQHITDREAVENYLAKIKVSGNHLLSLINDVLDMSRIESGRTQLEPHVASLTEMVSELQAIVQSNMEAEQLKFVVENQVHHPWVMVDKLRLNQVLLNIVGNAMKFTPTGGTIRFTLTETETTTPNAPCYTICIADTGIGMSEEFMKHIFEPFTREETSTVSGIQGSGLGMAITKNIVDMMHGDISVSSTPGQGSCFTITLHLTTAQAPHTSAQTATDADADMDLTIFEGRRILIAEDNELNRELIGEMLSSFGFELDIVEDGQIALERMQQHPAGHYDIVITDIQMPIMDGYALSRNIRALADPAKASIPILALTANAFEEDKQLALEAQMNGHLTKPIVIKEVLNCIKQQLEVRSEECNTPNNERGVSC